MRNLIIVCDEKYREFGDYLSQLISVEDDTVETTVGVKDGTVAAQVWLEKDYKANSATISSNQYILFVGNSKLIKEKRCHMKKVFSKYGITYGWLGKQAALTVEKTVPLKDYDEFISFAQKYEESIEQLITQKEMSKKTAIIASGSVGASLLSVVNPIALAPVVTLETVVAAQQIALNKKIKKQMYTCATMKFYLEDLNKFLGLE